MPHLSILNYVIELVNNVFYFLQNIYKNIIKSFVTHSANFASCQQLKFCFDFFINAYFFH